MPARHLDLLPVDRQLSASRLLRRLRAGAMRAVFVDPALHLGPEVADQALHRPDRAVGQRADRVALDLAW